MVLPSGKTGAMSISVAMTDRESRCQRHRRGRPMVINDMKERGKCQECGGKLNGLSNILCSRCASKFQCFTCGEVCYPGYRLERLAKVGQYRVCYECLAGLRRKGYSRMSRDRLLLPDGSIRNLGLVGEKKGLDR